MAARWTHDLKMRASRKKRAFLHLSLIGLLFLEAQAGANTLIGLEGASNFFGAGIGIRLQGAFSDHLGLCLRLEGGREAVELAPGQSALYHSNPTSGHRKWG